ncbi:VWA domain-containing protein [Actinocorallia libanotica]|uniref:VWFA domain-containing protein n=1 Tax=Actinocorallia libanotica TaxID=46162 RepID=A0ABP4CGX7_9ACTN
MTGEYPGLTAPSSAPTATAPAAAAIEWILLAPEQRFVLVIDRSGSMAGNKLAEAKFGADWWADNAVRGDRLGVVSFAGAASRNLGVTTINGDADRTSAQTAIAGLVAGGTTSIGGGLREGLNSILNAGPRAATQVMALLTDGLHNSGEHPSAVLPDLISNGVRVYTVGIGSSVDTALLQSIATATGGTFHRIDPNLSTSDQEFRIRTVLQEISGVARNNGGLVTTQPEALGEVPVERSVLIEPGSELATFGITWQGEENLLLLELVSPDGETITANSVPDGTRKIMGTRPYRAFQVDQPVAGNWKVSIRPEHGQGAVQTRLFVFSQNPHIDGALFSPRQAYEPGQTVPLFLQVYFNQPVTGLQVSGVARLPDGSAAPLRFDDTGDTICGDELARDGLYSALFDETHDQQGTYTFEVEVESDGKTVAYADSGELLLSGDSHDPEPIPRFKRRFQTSLIIGREPIKTGDRQED